MRIFFDTEFFDTGVVVNLISIGLVRDDGAEYYAESASYDYSGGDWLEKNVHPYLTGPKKPRDQIAREIVEFCGSDPEFWAYYASYDWLCLCQLYGRMLEIPAHWPKYVCDLRMLWDGKSAKPEQTETEHHALNDARWNKAFFRHLTRNDHA